MLNNLSKYQRKSTLYEIAGISRQAYFQSLNRSRSNVNKEKEILEKVLNFRKKNPQIGSRVMYKMLDIQDIGINKFERLLSQNNLCAQIKKNKRKTTRGHPEESDVNLINGLILNDINILIVGDITYYSVKGRFYYIFTLKDAYSKKLVGLGGYLHMTKENALKVLNQAIKERGEENLRGTIHHTDAGSQYKSNAYKQRLKECGIVMSIAGKCTENGMAEQLNYIIKSHNLDNYKIVSERQLNSILEKIKIKINSQIPVKILGYRTPNDFEKWIQTVDKQERPVQKLYDFEVDKRPV